MSDTTTERVRMTMRPPVLLLKEEWPLIASATKKTDFRSWFLRVREHTDKDKGCIVYGWYETSWHSERPAYAGYLCSREAVPTTLRQVGHEIGAPDHVVNDAIADLPTERL